MGQLSQFKTNLGKTYFTVNINKYVANQNEKYIGFEIDTDGSTNYVSKYAILENGTTADLVNSEDFN